MKRASRVGMSVLEVIVAMAVIAIASLGIIAALTRVMVAQSSTSHQTVARIIAEGAAREACLVGPPGWGGGLAPDVRSRQVRVGQSSELVEFHFDVAVSRVRESSQLGEGPTMGTLWQVQVRIWWNSENEPQAGIERGNQSLTVTRMVYVER